MILFFQDSLINRKFKRSAFIYNIISLLSLLFNLNHLYWIKVLISLKQNLTDLTELLNSSVHKDNISHYSKYWSRNWFFLPVAVMHYWLCSLWRILSFNKYSRYQNLVTSCNYLGMINLPHTFCLLHQSMKSNNQVSNPETDKPQEIPKEIWMMVDHLFRNAKNRSGLPFSHVLCLKLA